MPRVLQTKAIPNENYIPTGVPNCHDVVKILILFWIPLNIYFGEQWGLRCLSQKHSRHFQTDFELNKWQCSFSVARERCDERRVIPWENWFRLYEDSKGTDQHTHLHKMVCSNIVGTHDNILKFWKYPSRSDPIRLKTLWLFTMVWLNTDHTTSLLPEFAESV